MYSGVTRKAITAGYSWTSCVILIAASHEDQLNSPALDVHTEIVLSEFSYISQVTLGLPLL